MYILEKKNINGLLQGVQGVRKHGKIKKIAKICNIKIKY